MQTERIYLSDDKCAYLDAYISDARRGIADAMLIIPGGGYSACCADREGESIAFAFLARGFNSFVLTYRVGESYRYPDQLSDAARALLHIKSNAEKYKIDPERVFAVGFSAGGHLLGTLATISEREDVLKLLNAQKSELSLAGAIFSYPVITALHKTHEGSFCRLTGKAFEDITEEEKKRLSVETHITENAPPAFIWHTAEDKCVPLNGTFALAQKYIDVGRTMTLRVYPYGPHGIALGNEITDVDGRLIVPTAAHWVDEAIEWIKTL